MRPFVRDVLLFVAVQLGIVLGLQTVAARNSQSYLASTVDKQRRLAAAPAPRIVFVGGSSLAFGLDSALVETRLGRQPVNMGLFAPLGGRFMLRQAAAGLRDGDVVVLSLEYELYTNPSVYEGLDCKNWREMLMLSPGAASFMSRDIFLKMAREENGLACAGDLVKQAVRSVIPAAPQRPAYVRAAFNEYGDVALARAQLPEFKEQKTKRLAIDAGHLQHVIADIRNFDAACRERGIRVLLIMPCTPESRYAAEGTTFDAIEAEVRRHGGVPVIVGARDASLPDALFYDTIYHLTTDGARVRTEALCERLGRMTRRNGE